MRLRPVTPDDLPDLRAWFAQPHVDRWWHQDPARIEADYLTPSDATVLVAVVDERAVGLGQHYLWDDCPADRDAYGIPAGTVGIDYLVGLPFDCERGHGTALVAALLAVTPPRPVWVTPEAANEPSCAVLEKNGFTRMAVKQCRIPDEPWAGPTALYALQR